MDLCRSAHLECFVFVDDGKISSKRWRIPCIYAFVIDVDWVHWTKGFFIVSNKGTNAVSLMDPLSSLWTRQRRVLSLRTDIIVLVVEIEVSKQPDY